MPTILGWACLMYIDFSRIEILMASQLQADIQGFVETALVRR